MCSHKQKILFVWTGVTSYMGDCWRRLSACADVELKVVIADRSGGYGTAFQNEKVMRGFLFVGRLSNEKRIDVLATAYRAHRRAVADPWGLDVYGIGAREPWLRGIPGVVLHGFAQPDELPRAYACAQALVLPSAWDPWPLVIAESCAAGVPVICTDRCWNVPELVKANGSVVRSGDARALTAAMLKVSSLDGSVGKRLIADYSCEKWVERVRRIINDTGASAC